MVFKVRFMDLGWGLEEGLRDRRCTGTRLVL